MFVKHYAPGGNIVRKSYSKHKGKSQGHQDFDFGCIWKRIINGVSMPDMKSRFKIKRNTSTKMYTPFLIGFN